MPYGSVGAAGFGAMQQAMLQREMAARQKHIDEQNARKADMDIKTAEANIATHKASEEIAKAGEKRDQEKHELAQKTNKQAAILPLVPMPGMPVAPKLREKMIDAELGDLLGPDTPALPAQVGLPAPGAVIGVAPTVEPPAALIAPEAAATPPEPTPTLIAPEQPAVPGLSLGTPMQQHMQALGEALKSATTRDEAASIAAQYVPAAQVDDLVNAKFGPRVALPASAQEYEYSNAQRKANGQPPQTYSQYQDEDANRKQRAASGAGDASRNRRIDAVVSRFNSSPIVKNYNKVQEAVDFVTHMDKNTHDPAADQALIYAFAKAMDPDSAVREGEYATVQKYAQSWISRVGFDVRRILDETQILEPGAREQLIRTITDRAKPLAKQYENFYKESAGNIKGLDPEQVGMLPRYQNAFSEPEKVKLTPAELRAKYSKPKP